MSPRTLTLALLLTTCATLPAQVPGSVSGTVVDNAGKPVVHARIFISRALPSTTARPAAPPVITGPRVITTMTDHTGAFLSGHLPAGDYVACAQFPAQGLLDPCHWAATAPQFTVTSGKTTTGVQIVMTKGAVLPIHIDDPHQLLQTPKGALASDLHVQVVTAKGHHYEAIIVASSKNSRDHQITLPFGTTVSVQVVCPHLAVDDDTGKPATAAGKSVSVASGSAPGQLKFTVTGAK